MFASILKRMMLASIGLMLTFCVFAETVTVTYDTDEQILINPEDIPVSMPEVIVPTVNVPTVEVPVTNAVTMELKVINSFPFSTYTSTTVLQSDLYTNVIKDAKTGSILIADVEDNELYVTTIDTSVGEVKVKIADVSYVKVGDLVASLVTDNGKMKLIEVNTGKVLVPEVEIQQVSEGSVNLVYVDTGTVVAADVKMTEVTITNVAIPTVDDPNTRISNLVALLKELRTKVHDTRSIDHDKTISIDNPAIRDWMSIYEEFANKPYTMQYIQMHHGLKMITEARVPKTDEEKAIQLDNLDWYKAKGYNAVLLSIYMDEQLVDLIELANEITKRGYDLYITYTGIESLYTSVFLDPVLIQRYLATLAPMAKGYLLGWRKTSVHLFIHDPQFTQYLVKCVRDANDKIEILGEGYYGQTADSNLRTDVLTYNMPENASACILSGVGYRNVNAGGVLKGLFGALTKTQKIPVVLGDRAYYKTTNPNGYSFEKNFAIKQEIENKFLRYGAYGIITLHGDGRSEITDTLTSPRN